MKILVYILRDFENNSKKISGSFDNNLSKINSVFTSVFTWWRVACKDAGRAAYSQLHLHVTGEYNCQQAGIRSQTTEYVARHPVYTQRVHSYSRSQKFEISSVNTRLRLAVYTNVSSKNASIWRVKMLVKTPLMSWNIRIIENLEYIKKFGSVGKYWKSSGLLVS